MKTIDAVARNIEIIGEAVSKLPDSLKERYPQVEWKRIKGMRNRIIHEYFGVDVGIAWTIITDNLPLLEKEIHSILSDYNKSDSNLI